MILYLVRHGYSFANQKRLVTGTPDDELNDLGRRQAVRLAGWLKKWGMEPERFIVSHWRRAIETAAILFPEAPWEVDARLGETDAGYVADIPVSKFMGEYPSFYGDPGNIYPGGESHIDLNNRVLEWVNEQLANPCRSILIVSHSGPISCMLQYVQRLDMSSFPAYRPQHATLSIIQFRVVNGDWKGRVTGFSLGPIGNIREITCENYA